MLKRKILVVEDELITATDVKFALEDMGHEVVGTASTGEDAIKLAADKHPNLVLMDINLQGDINGIEASKKILNMNIPVVYLTAHSDEDTFEKANIKPASGFLSKPFDNKKLKRVVELAINRQNFEEKKATITEEIAKQSETKEELLDKLKDIDMKLYDSASTQYREEEENGSSNSQPTQTKDESDAKKILIVEDEQITALDIKLKLEDFGYIVVGTAQTGQEAVEKAFAENPDLILMDITLQGEMTGIDATKKIEPLNIPIVYLTANTNDNTINEALETAPYGYISKPFDDTELKQGVAIALKKHNDNVKKLENYGPQLKDRIIELDLKQTTVLLVILGSIITIIIGYFSESLEGYQYIVLIILIIIAIAYYLFAMYKRN